MGVRAGVAKIRAKPRRNIREANMYAVVYEASPKNELLIEDSFWDWKEIVKLEVVARYSKAALTA